MLMETLINRFSHCDMVTRELDSYTDTSVLVTIPIGLKGSTDTSVLTIPIGII